MRNLSLTLNNYKTALPEELLFAPPPPPPHPYELTNLQRHLKIFLPLVKRSKDTSVGWTELKVRDVNIQRYFLPQGSYSDQEVNTPAGQNPDPSPINIKITITSDQVR